MVLKKEKFAKGIMTMINAAALLLVVQTANSACIWLSHQPEFPEEAQVNMYICIIHQRISMSC